MTKHLLIAVGLVVASFLALGIGISAAADGDAEAGADGGKGPLGIHVVPAERALGPIIPELASTDAAEARNPFTMKSGVVRSTRIPFPPPPALDLPPLPVLPVSER